MAEIRYLTKEECDASLNHIDNCIKILKEEFNKKENFKKKDLSLVSYMKEGELNGDESV